MELIAGFRDVVQTIYEIFIAPGNVIVSVLVSFFPTLTELPGVENPGKSTPLVFTLSILAWLTIAVILLHIYRRLQNLGRVVASSCATILFRLSLAGHNLKRALVAPLLRFRVWRQSKGVESNTIEFSTADIAVLKSAVAQPPGITVSAPELAEQFTMRPSQLQRCLDRLCEYRMIESVIGSTDGFDNYRVTPAGAHFCQQMKVTA